MNQIRILFLAAAALLFFIAGCSRTVRPDVDMAREIEKMLIEPVPAQEAPAPVSQEPFLPAAAGDWVIPDEPEVAGQIERIAGPYHDLMQQSLDRSAIWRQMVEAEIDARNLPPGLIAVLLQESAFSPAAVSRTGAAGLWQFIPATGRMFGLQRDAFVDERFDPVASTRAALDYLAQLHEQFGDWPLALAAYNWGKGALSRCIEANGGERDFWALSRTGAIREETMNYVPAIYARLAIWRDPNRFGFSMPPATPPVPFDLPPLTDIPRLENACGLAPGEIELLNPHLLSGYSPPYFFDGRIHVPAHALSALEQLDRSGRLKGLTGSPDSLRTVRRVGHVVKKGESLWSIAQHYETSVDSLLSYNGWSGPPSMKQGMTVVVFLPR